MGIHISELWDARAGHRRAAVVLTLAAPTGAVATAAAVPAHASAAPISASAASTAVTGAVSSNAGLSAQVAATVKGTGVAAQERALTAYWTPARMKAALPESELPAVKHAAVSKSATPTAAKLQGAAAQVGPAAGKVTHPVGVTSKGYAYNPYHPVGTAPAITIGKAYFTLGFHNYVCDATTVNSEGKSTMWTAGHCVTGGGAWAGNWIFLPNCDNGPGTCASPFTYWYAKQLWAPGAYISNNGDLADDVGAAVMWPDSGYEIVNYLGGQGIEWNYPTSVFVCALGYSGASLVEVCGTPSSGCLASFAGGETGGPWLASFDGSYGYIDGHSDFRYVGLSGGICSPYYGNQVAGLYGAVRNLVG